MIAGGLTGNVLLSRWTSSGRFQSTDAFTDDVDPKETQRLKDEEIVYETEIKHKILNAALGYVDVSGWSKQALAEGVQNQSCLSDFFPHQICFYLSSTQELKA